MPDLRTFRKAVYAHYTKEGRTLPWRSRPTPYNVFVSEVMLQQTPVDRVIPKFREFVRAFPSFRALAAAPAADVIRAWSGLGYNRRALALHRAAKAIASDHGGGIPRSAEALEALPGIGPATARSILAFAFDEPAVFIETNIRSVFIHHFFIGRHDVADAEILPLVEAALDRRRPREWYSALMDYGSSLKRLTLNPSRRSRHHARQVRFEGSDRQIRGAVLKALVKGPLTKAQALALLDRDPARVRRIIGDLVSEGLVAARGGILSLPR
ncbi:A/G-specific adenine glycosylase [Candidatus Woesearchaeota archaeon]|nr:A/G-specific adenine glycosylase [Candidatus Woesearchaeota archaeon]